MKIIKNLRGRGKVVSIFVVLVVAVMFFSACEKDDEETIDQGPEIIDITDEILKDAMPVKYGQSFENVEKELPQKVEAQVRDSSGERRKETLEIKDWEPGDYDGEKSDTYDIKGTVDYEGEGGSFDLGVRVCEEGEYIIELGEVDDLFADREAGYDYEEIEITIKETLGVDAEDLDVSLLIEGENNEETIVDENKSVESLPAKGEEKVDFTVGEITASDTYTATISVDGDYAEIEEEEEFVVSPGNISKENSSRSSVDLTYDNELSFELKIKDEYENSISGEFNVNVGDVYSEEKVFEDGKAEITFTLTESLEEAPISINDDVEIDSIDKTINNVANHDQEEGDDTIKDALSAAEAGHELEVFPGNYTGEGQITVDKEDISLVSKYEEYGAEEPQASIESIDIAARGIEVSGFEIMGRENLNEIYNFDYIYAKYRVSETDEAEGEDKLERILDNNQFQEKGTNVELVGPDLAGNNYIVSYEEESEE